MIEPFASSYAVLTTGGNHEFDYGEAWQPYKARYPMPFAASRSATNLWWSIDVGPMHLVSLCSYANGTQGSLQHRWLARDLAAVDRSLTPWLVVMLHVPWYHSNSQHSSGAESDEMREAMEALLYSAGADIVLAGHPSPSPNRNHRNRNPSPHPNPSLRVLGGRRHRAGGSP